jgi:hypothetical protein
MIQLFQQRSDGFIQFRQREELLVPEGGQNPALRYRYRIFDLGFVPWFVFSTVF